MSKESIPMNDRRWLTAYVKMIEEVISSGCAMEIK